MTRAGERRSGGCRGGERRAVSGRTLAAGLLLAAAAPLLGACATASATGAGAGALTGGSARTAAEKIAHEAEPGIRVEALRLSSAGYTLDFRYRVVDAARAAPLLDRKQRPYLMDARGAKLGVPETPILGSLRQTSRNGKISTTHTYFILFANPGKYLRSGDQVTLVVGDTKLPGLTVE